MRNSDMDAGLLKKELRLFAEQMLESHGLTDWRFGWKRDAPEEVIGGTWESFGHTDHARKFIFLNDRYALDPSFDVTNAVLHEIAHAKAGPGHGHDSTWLSVAKRIGVKDLHPDERTDYTFAKSRGVGIFGKPTAPRSPAIRHDVNWIPPQAGEKKGHWELAKPPLSW